MENLKNIAIKEFDSKFNDKTLSMIALYRDNTPQEEVDYAISMFPHPSSTLNVIIITKPEFESVFRGVRVPCLWEKS